MFSKNRNQPILIEFRGCFPHAGDYLNFVISYLEKTHILTMLYRSHLTIFRIDNQREKRSKKNAMGWSTTTYFPIG